MRGPGAALKTDGDAGKRGVSRGDVEMRPAVHPNKLDGAANLRREVRFWHIRDPAFAK